jgi:hypothetical protein
LPGRNRLKATTGTLPPVSFTATGRLLVPTVVLAGTVSLPPGIQLDVASLRVRTSVSDVAVGAEGQFTTMALANGTQLAAAHAPNGKPVLLGWLDENTRALSVRTTAEVMVYFDLFASLSPDAASRRATRASIRERDDLYPLENAIVAALAAAPAVVTLETEGIRTARRALQQALLGQAAPPARAIIVEPTGPRSGISVDQVGFNQVIITNTLRRRVVAFLDRVSYVSAGGGNPVAAPQAGLPIPIGPVTGVQSLVGTFVDVATGNLALTPVITDPLPTPLFPTDARSSQYRVIVVGPGASNPAVRLTAEQERFQLRAGVETLALDCILPLLEQVMSIDGENRILADGSVYEPLLTAFLENMPASLLEQAAAGDMQGALAETLKLLAGNAAVQERILDAVLSSLAQRIGMADPAAVLARAKEWLAALSWVDYVLGIADIAIVLTHASASLGAEVWDITVTGSKVSLIPAQVSMSRLDIRTFEARVQATGDPTPTLRYRWSTTGRVGKICSANPWGCNTAFESSRAFVSYAPDVLKVGTDEIRVEVYVLVDGREQVVGEASATVTVQAGKVSLQPQVASLQPGATTTFTASVDDELQDGGTLTYLWSTTGTYGTLTRSLNGFETSQNTVTYTARSGVRGTDIVTVEVFSTKDGTRRSLARAAGLAWVEAAVWRLDTFNLLGSSGKWEGTTAQLTDDLIAPIAANPEGALFRIILLGDKEPNGVRNTTGPSALFHANTIEVLRAADSKNKFPEYDVNSAFFIGGDFAAATLAGRAVLVTIGLGDGCQGTLRVASFSDLIATTNDTRITGTLAVTHRNYICVEGVVTLSGESQKAYGFAGSRVR